MNEKKKKRGKTSLCTHGLRSGAIVRSIAQCNCFQWLKLKIGTFMFNLYL